MSEDSVAWPAPGVGPQGASSTTPDADNTLRFIIALIGGLMVLAGLLFLPWLSVTERGNYGEGIAFDVRFHKLADLVGAWEYAPFALLFLKGGWILAYLLAIGVPIVLKGEQSAGVNAAMRGVVAPLVAVVGFLLWEAVSRLEVVFLAFITASEVSDGPSNVRQQMQAGCWVTLAGLILLFCACRLAPTTAASGGSHDPGVSIEGNPW